MTEAEFFNIYEQYADAIFRHCYFRVSDREIAKDLAQDAFVKTWQALEKGKQIENIKAFIYKVATNAIIDYYRKNKEVSLDYLKETGLDFVMENREGPDFMELQRVLKHLNRLHEKYRQVVVLRYVEDLSPKEIADLLGRSENAVSVQIHRGIEQLKKYLDAE